jgi:hypothetical protein
MAIVEDGFPVLLLGQDDEANASPGELAGTSGARGALVIGAGIDAAAGITLPTLAADPVMQRCSGCKASTGSATRCRSRGARIRIPGRRAYRRTRRDLDADPAPNVW